MSTTKNRLNAVQEIMNILEKFDSADREQILRCVSGESNIESNKERQHNKPGVDQIALMFAVFKESIEQNNKDKRYWLTKLKEMNEIAEAMGDYLQELNAAEAHLEYSNENKVKIKLRRFKMNNDSSENEEQSTYVIITKEELAVEILNLVLLLEESRNKREEFTARFENFDQKANQLFNILSTVMKSLKEMNSSVTRNIS